MSLAQDNRKHTPYKEVAVWTSWRCQSVQILSGFIGYLNPTFSRIPSPSLTGRLSILLELLSLYMKILVRGFRMLDCICSNSRSICSFISHSKQAPQGVVQSWDRIGWGNSYRDHNPKVPFKTTTTTWWSSNSAREILEALANLHRIMQNYQGLASLDLAWRHPFDTQVSI